MQAQKQMVRTIQARKQGWPRVKGLPKIELNTIYATKLPSGEVLHLYSSGENALTAIVTGTKTLLQVDAPRIWQFTSCGK